MQAQRTLNNVEEEVLRDDRTTDPLLGKTARNAPERTWKLAETDFPTVLGFLSQETLQIGPEIFTKYAHTDTYTVHLYTVQTTRQLKERIKLRIKNGELTGRLEHVSNTCQKRTKRIVFPWKAGEELRASLQSVSAIKSALLKERTKALYRNLNQSFVLAIDVITPLMLDGLIPSGVRRFYLELECDAHLTSNVAALLSGRNGLQHCLSNVEYKDTKWIVAQEVNPRPVVCDNEMLMLVRRHLAKTLSKGGRVRETCL